MLVLFGVVGGSFWNTVAKQAEKDKQEEARQENEAIRAIYVEAGRCTEENGVCRYGQENCFYSRHSKRGNLQQE